MKITIIIVAIVLVLVAVVGFYVKQQLSGMEEGAKIIIVMSKLNQAADQLRKIGTFTNDVPNLCEIYRFTNSITLGQTQQQQCVLAAKSSAFQEAGMMAITANDTLVWIDRDGKATPFNDSEAVKP
jgi:Rad3-related DNA helicase